MMDRLMVLCEAEKERRAEPSGTVRLCDFKKETISGERGKERSWRPSKGSGSEAREERRRRKQSSGDCLHRKDWNKSKEKEGSEMG